MEFRLLGPVEVSASGLPVEIGSPQQRLLLAALAADAGRLVTVETLIDRLWDDAPNNARRMLLVLISRLRRVLAGAAAAGREQPVVARGSGGYVLHVDPSQVDVHQFRLLASDARQPNTGARVERLREALAWWQGEPLPGLPGQWAARMRAAWQQEHLDVVVAWAQAELQAGDPAAAVGPLTAMATQYPLAESLSAVLMRTLSAVGRPADALAHYGQVRQRLADELGVSPGPGIQAVYQSVLRGEAGAAGGPASVAHGAAAVQPAIQALTRRCLGLARAHLGHYDEALNHLNQAVSLAEPADDVTALAHLEAALGAVRDLQGNFELGVTHASRALSLFRTLGLSVWEANVLSGMAWRHAHLGNLTDAWAACHAALALLHQHDDRHGQANTTDALGYIAVQAGDCPQALNYYNQALRLWRDLGHTHGEADSLGGLAVAYAASGEHAKAATVSRQAFELFRAQHRTSDADNLQRQLDSCHLPEDHRLYRCPACPRRADCRAAKSQHHSFRIKALKARSRYGPARVPQASGAPDRVPAPTISRGATGAPSEAPTCCMTLTRLEAAPESSARSRPAPPWSAARAPRQGPRRAAAAGRTPRSSSR
jgi:DNA-binding SARP family transcriptional activator